MLLVIAVSQRRNVPPLLTSMTEKETASAALMTLSFYNIPVYIRAMTMATKITMTMNAASTTTAAAFLGLLYLSLYCLLLRNPILLVVVSSGGGRDVGKGKIRKGRKIGNKLGHIFFKVVGMVAIITLYKWYR